MLYLFVLWLFDEAMYDFGYSVWVADYLKQVTRTAYS